MDISILITIVGAIAVLNTLTVEAVKKVLDSMSLNYSSNILAVITSVLLSVIGCVLYVVYNHVAMSSELVVDGIVIVYFSFLSSTVTFDKVKQALLQLKG